MQHINLLGVSVLSFHKLRAFSTISLSIPEVKWFGPEVILNYVYEILAGGGLLVTSTIVVLII